MNDRNRDDEIWLKAPVRPRVREHIVDRHDRIRELQDGSVIERSTYHVVEEFDEPGFDGDYEPLVGTREGELIRRNIKIQRAWTLLDNLQRGLAGRRVKPRRNQS